MTVRLLPVTALNSQLVRSPTQGHRLGSVGVDRGEHGGGEPRRAAELVRGVRHPAPGQPEL